jgi:hypothetical protein
LRAKFDCEVTAGFLESGRVLCQVANAAAIISGINGAGFNGAAINCAGVLTVVSLAAWMIGIWYSVRVAIDRSLFRTLAANPEARADWLDSLLLEWKLVKVAGSRSIAERSRGALQLWRMQAAALIVQLATLAAAEILRAVHG